MSRGFVFCFPKGNGIKHCLKAKVRCRGFATGRVRWGKEQTNELAGVW